MSQHKQFYYCFGCGAHGNAIDFLIQYERLNFKEALETLARQVGLEMPNTFQRDNKEEIDSSLYTLLMAAGGVYQRQLRQSKRVIAYLKNRGISGIIAKQFGLGYATAEWGSLLNLFGKTAEDKRKLLQVGLIISKEDGKCYDRFRDRVMFPIHDKRGRVIGFGGRIIDQGEPKYLNSPETPIFQKGHTLYGLHQVLAVNHHVPRVLVVEGYMDVIALFQHEITYAVATLGTATTAFHAQMLFRYASEIVFCFDGDDAGRRAAWRALEVLFPLMRDDLQIRFMFLPDGEDPDSLVRREGKVLFEERVIAAMPFSQFFFHALCAQADLSTMEGRAHLAARGLTYIKQLSPCVFRNVLLEELARRTRIQADQLLQQVGSSAAAGAIPVEALLPKKSMSAPMRLAITLLIQHPTLVQCLEEPLPPLVLPGFAFFMRLIELCQQNPQMTTGSLKEYWRGQQEEKYIEKLAQQDLVIPEEGVKAEFLASIQKLLKIANEQSIQQLLSKASLEGLTEEEKSHLSQIIRKKQGSIET
ncbi:MAG: DNA primase [uncultured bacterium]|nr:MAG: DNA primase [uncultured bacterium]